MNKINLKTRTHKLLADTITPVSMYLKLRDRFAITFLLESSDYHGNENSFSYICCSPLAHISVKSGVIEKQLPGSPVESKVLQNLQGEIEEFCTHFTSNEPNDDFIKTGLFGYLNYDAVSDFNGVHIENKDDSIPLAQYHLFQFVIALDHFKNTCYLVETYIDEVNDALFNEVITLIQQHNIPNHPFTVTGEKRSNKTDAQYLDMVKKGIHHCQIGDVFQVVLSRNFFIPYQGDDFQVYRALRSINPSPYLFYFDYGDFRLFGSSPEAQVILKNRKAEIHPIAGTFERTGDDQADRQLAEQLLNDIKENAEHIMLVDLARNDLSRSCDRVTVEKYKEVQFYSHVIHLVSKVTGEIRTGASFMDVVADTFPAGTLSGAPKIRAMEIIGECEQTPRGFYGGAVGFMDFSGNFNHAIMIRSFLSKNNILKFQAGAGIVAKSNPDSELAEVYNKVRALECAIEYALEYTGREVKQ